MLLRLLALSTGRYCRRLLCGRIFFGARFPLVTSPQTQARKDYAREVHTFEQFLAVVPFFPGFFNLVPRALGEFDGVI